MCYTYDNLSRVTARTVKKLSDNSVVSTETFNYDAAGNVTSAPDSSFQYDTNNRLVVFNGNSVSYDPDGNMLSNGSLTCTYDSANRLVSAGGHTHTYNAEDVRIRNLCSDEDTTYTYNTNAKLSMLLMKTANGVVTKYVYGKGLIGEEVNNTFKTYHFDCRGSTIAITDASGNITDTFAYDTYGKLLTRTGTSKVIFGYNGRDGVVTDDNGLIYMRARYYSPEMKRFINADVVAGAISNAITLNRFAYANGNPVSFVDPFGLHVFDWFNKAGEWIGNKANDIKDWAVDTYNEAKDAIVDTYNEVKDWVVDTYNDAKQAIVETYNEVKDQVIDTYNDTKIAFKATASWVDNNVVKPSKEALANARRQIKDGLNSAAKRGQEIGTQVKEIAKNTFGAGVVQSQQYEDMSVKTLFGGYEKGHSTSSVICGDISKPISIYAKNASKWWKIWEYKVGLQVNINGGGFYLEANPFENALGVSNGNTSFELMSGLNKIGYTASYDVNFSERTSAGMYHHGYIRTIPTALAVVTAVYCWPAFSGALVTGILAGATS